MIVSLARKQDFVAFLDLAAQVEHWFGPMVDDLGFQGAVNKHIRRSTALIARSAGSDVLGGLLLGVQQGLIKFRRRDAGLVVTGWGA